MWSNITIEDFKNNYEQLIINIIKEHPTAKILGLTPMKFSYKQDYDTNHHCYRYDAQNPITHITLKDIVDAEIEIFNKYGIKYIDMYTESGMTPDIDEFANLYFFNGDNEDRLHPNKNGNFHILGPKIARALINL